MLARSRISGEPGQMMLSLEADRQIYRVRELNAAVQTLFDAKFRNIWVAGEISACRAVSSGHFYFCLKDEQSQLKCVLFKSSARFLKFKPADGLAVLVRGNLEIYEARGEYQLIVELLEPAGAGALQLAFEQLKKKLAAEGLFDSSRKRPLPEFPRRIGLITSATGAVIRDILHVLERRFPGLHIRLFPVQVQGEGSAEQICQAIEYFSDTSWAEVVIVARGGGSPEDLWTFNEEAVARGIAASKPPIISAVGHETDFTIADFVADHRAPTPSAAAEIVICTRESLFDRIDGGRTKLTQAIRYRLVLSSRDLHQSGSERAAALLHRIVTRRAQRLDDADSQLRTRQQQQLTTLRRSLEECNRRLQATDLRLRFTRNRHRNELLATELLKSVRTKLWHLRRKHESLEAHLTQLSPLAVLGRGYAIVENSAKQILTSPAQTRTGEKINVRLHRGELEAVVSTASEEA